jgi:hypothetical protein
LAEAGDKAAGLKPQGQAGDLTQEKSIERAGSPVRAAIVMGFSLSIRPIRNA